MSQNIAIEICNTCCFYNLTLLMIFNQIKMLVKINVQ